jgi:hypothetical protein
MQLPSTHNYFPNHQIMHIRSSPGKCSSTNSCLNSKLSTSEAHLESAAPVDQYPNIKLCISEAHLENAYPPTLVWIPNYPHQKLTWKVQLPPTLDLIFKLSTSKAHLENAAPTNPCLDPKPSTCHKGSSDWRHIGSLRLCLAWMTWWSLPYGVSVHNIEKTA